MPRRRALIRCGCANLERHQLILLDHLHLDIGLRFQPLRQAAHVDALVVPSKALQEVGRQLVLGAALFQFFLSFNVPVDDILVEVHQGHTRLKRSHDMDRVVAFYPKMNLDFPLAGVADAVKRAARGPPATAFLYDDLDRTGAHLQTIWPRVSRFRFRPFRPWDRR